MGNWLWCSHAASGERLAAAARDGDMAEAKMLLDHNPGLASYSSAFTALNSPLHFAASKGHAQIVMLLLENGADANSKNFYGQTALMQACRQGHWEVVLFLLLYNTDVTRAESLGGKTALHFAAAAGHVRCIKLLVADFDPSAPYAANVIPMDIDKHGDSSSSRRKGSFYSSSRSRSDISALSKFVNKVADGGVTALHLATLNGHSDCVQLLLDLHADVSAVTAHYGSTSKMIGAGSTPLHFAACGGNLKCCQILLARGASRLTANYNGFLPVDLAKIWGHRFLLTLLSPHSDLKIPTFPPSSYLCLPLMSVLNIARECRLKSLTASADENDLCAVCLENACSVAANECAHELCVKCALYLCSTSNIAYQVDGPPGSLPCPLCRNGIVSFVKVGPDTSMEEVELDQYESNLCRSKGHDPTLTCRSHFCRSCIVSLSVSSSQII